MMLDFKRIAWLYLICAAHVYWHTSGQPTTPTRFKPDTKNVGSDDTDWVKWVVISAMPSVKTDVDRQNFIDTFDPDMIDWYGGMSFNRGEFARARGVACSASEEFEYEESLQFSPVIKDSLLLLLAALSHTILWQTNKCHKCHKCHTHVQIPSTIPATPNS